MATQDGPTPRWGLPLFVVLVVAGIAARLVDGLGVYAAGLGGASAIFVLVWSGRRPSPGSAPLLLLGVALATAWFADRPPWGPLPSAVLWTGSLLIVTGLALGRRAPGPSGSLVSVVLVGLVSGVATGYALAQSFDVRLASVLLMVAGGRLASWTLLDADERGLAGPLVLLSAAAPSAAGVWALAAATVESVGLYAAGRIDRGAPAWPYGLGAAGVAVGVGLAGRVG